jgi:hypothetical protein
MPCQSSCGSTWHPSSYLLKCLQLMEGKGLDWFSVVVELGEDDLAMAGDKRTPSLAVVVSAARLPERRRDDIFHQHRRLHPHHRPGL